MSVELYKKLLPVITAYAEGKQIQVKSKDSIFTDFIGGKFGLNPDFSDPFWEWRVKPELPKYRVALMEYDSGFMTLSSNNVVDDSIYEANANFVRWLTDWIEYDPEGQ